MGSGRREERVDMQRVALVEAAKATEAVATGNEVGRQVARQRIGVTGEAEEYASEEGSSRARGVGRQHGGELEKQTLFGGTLAHWGVQREGRKGYEKGRVEVGRQECRTADRQKGRRGGGLTEDCQGRKLDACKDRRRLKVWLREAFGKEEEGRRLG